MPPQRGRDIGVNDPSRDPPLDRPPINAADLVAETSNGMARPLLRGAKGQPWLAVGDAAWSYIAQLDGDGAAEYLSDRAALGFNLIVVNLIEHRFSEDPPSNVEGVQPFLEPGRFDRPNPEYFDHAHRLVSLAEEAGFVVMLSPAYLGYSGTDEGWLPEMEAAGPKALREYGRFVGERFADLANIIWLAGCDYAPSPAQLELVEAVRQGLVDAGAKQPHTALWQPESVSSDQPVPWLDLALTYTYTSIPDASKRAMTSTDIPHVLVESHYEGGFGRAGQQRIRSQMYESVLAGASGSVFGNESIWQFAPGWRDSLDSAGARHMEIATNFLRRIEWERYEPGWRSPGVAATIRVESDLVWSTDGTSVVVYVPDDADVRVAWPQGAPAMQYAEWFDPSDGSSIVATAQTREGMTHYAHPGPNAFGDSDWVLVARMSA